MSGGRSAGAPAAGHKRGGRRVKPSCETCYFGKRMLCALELGHPCSTFRPDSPDGLTPPAQPMLLLGAAPAASEITVDSEAGEVPAAA